MLPADPNSDSPKPVRWITGSGLFRLAMCPGSASLPQGELGDTREARHGTKAHADLEAGRVLPAFQDELEQLAWYPVDGLHEVVCWYDPATKEAGWEQQTGGHRDYDRFPTTAIVGTVDFLHPQLGWVDDLKTGSWVPAPSCDQLGLAAVALAHQNQIKVVRATITHLPRRYPTQKVRHEYTWSPLDLGRMRARLDGMRAGHLLELERQVGVKTLRPGDHCKFCKSAGCPVDPRPPAKRPSLP